MQYATGIRLLRGGSTVATTRLIYQRVGGDSGFNMIGAGLPTGRWVHVALTFVPPGTAGQGPEGSVTLTVDGSTLASYRNVISVDYYAAASTATVLSIGLSRYRSVTPIRRRAQMAGRRVRAPTAPRRRWCAARCRALPPRSTALGDDPTA